MTDLEVAVQNMQAAVDRMIAAVNSNYNVKLRSWQLKDAMEALANATTAAPPAALASAEPTLEMVRAASSVLSGWIDSDLSDGIALKVGRAMLAAAERKGGES